MRHENTLMHDLMQFVPWHRFEQLVDKHDSDRRVRRLSTKSQLVALLHAQLSGAVSLREIEPTMSSHAARLYHLGVAAPKRSTLANATRPSAVFADLFGVVLKQVRSGLRKASKDASRLIDSSRITLNALSRSWAHYDATCDGVKLHIVYDPDMAMPVHFAVSPARTNDMVAAKEMAIEPGATYVFDMGYYSFVWWAKLDAAGCRFVTRLKKNTPTRVLQERPVAAGGKVVLDRIVRVRERLARTRSTVICASFTSSSITASACGSSPMISMLVARRSPSFTRPAGRSSCSSAGSSRP